MPITTTMRVDESEERFVKCVRALMALGWMEPDGMRTLETLIRSDAGSPNGKWLIDHAVMSPRIRVAPKKGGGK